MTTTNESSTDNRFYREASAQPADGGPAFPRAIQRWNDSFENVEGMTLRQYAAIKLRVPDSGIDWLDDMIRTSMQDEFAAKAMQGLSANPGGPFQANDRYGWGLVNCTLYQVCEDAYAVAEAMLKARG
ncbi:hypothetical protein [Burkholderia gladioli]|uniref:hypothetical protein n=1 Tax=Burkholderia gladioli TaxID=28095 RepID=UPI00163F4317|nr:hypothetical protein [Burkholderia gladioli]